MFLFVFVYFETGSHCVALAGLQPLQYASLLMNAK